MKARRAALAAGLALGLMSGTAKAASITYYVDLKLIGGTNVTGFIETDGAIGDVRRKDIIDLELHSGQTYVTDADLKTGNLYLQATVSQLTFSAGESFINIDGDNGIVTTNNFASSSALYFSSEYFDEPYGRRFLLDGVDIPAGSDYVIGTVPLPASAPMFGAAMVTLGAVGFGLKRKAQATA